jgi:hypothetical protein
MGRRTAKQEAKPVGIDGGFMEIKTLASSSKGNCYIIGRELMIECGIPLKEIKRKGGFKVHEIQSCLVSHEH